MNIVIGSISNQWNNSCSKQRQFPKHFTGQRPHCSWLSCKDHVIFKSIFDTFNIGTFNSAKTGLQNVSVLWRPNWTNAFWTASRTQETESPLLYSLYSSLLSHPAVKHRHWLQTQSRLCLWPSTIPCNFHPSLWSWLLCLTNAWIPWKVPIFNNAAQKCFICFKVSRRDSNPYYYENENKTDFWKKKIWNTDEKQKDAKNTWTKSL